MKMDSNQKQPTDRTKLFTRLYLDIFPVVAAFIAKRGGTLEQTKDLFQEALIIYYEQMVIQDRDVRKSDQAYIIGIVKNLWFQMQKKETLFTSVDILENNLAETIDQSPSTGRIRQVLETAGQKCMAILQSFYYEQLPLDQIAKRFGFSVVILII